MYNNESFLNICIYHILDGLRHGLSHFSGLSRAALIYVRDENAPVHIYDPQNLLRGHESILEDFFLNKVKWKQGRARQECDFDFRKPDDLELSGMISYGVYSNYPYYQMWFTEHHPNMCSLGPTKRWLEQAAWLFIQEMSTKNVLCLGSSSYMLQECSRQAVRDFIVDERIKLIGPDTQLRIYPLIEAVLNISRTPEEGSWPRGILAFVEPNMIADIDFSLRFPVFEQPFLQNSKHVRKLLQSVECLDYKLVSDGNCIVGIARGRMPLSSLLVDFRATHGFIKLEEDRICSFSDGQLYSSNRRAKLVQLEEVLLETNIAPAQKYSLLNLAKELVHSAEDRKHGITLVLDFHNPVRFIAGQHLQEPLDLADEEHLEMVKSLSKVDGALHISADSKLHGFACLLDGKAVYAENRARGARFNSALRFTAKYSDLVVVVVSSDRPVSIIQGGIELTAQCAWKPVSGHAFVPPKLEDWLGSNC